VTVKEFFSIPPGMFWVLTPAVLVPLLGWIVARYGPVVSGAAARRAERRREWLTTLVNGPTNVLLGHIAFRAAISTSLGLFTIVYFIQDAVLSIEYRLAMHSSPQASIVHNYEHLGTFISVVPLLFFTLFSLASYDLVIFCRRISRYSPRRGNDNTQ
jgi:hypothetical protein